jgi:hypothetical protein
LAIIAVASAKGSPGVTTTCLALALTWPRPVLLVEADPAGGDIMAGYVRAEIGGDRGLAYLAVAARRDTLDEELRAQLVDLGPERPAPNAPAATRLLLPGVTDPVESAGVAPSWPRLADFFVELSDPAGAADDRQPIDVIVDCGRLISTYPPITVMAVADVVLLGLRSSLRSASSTAPVVAALRRELAGAGGDPGRVGLAVIEGGEYRTADLGRALGVPVVVTLPWREKEAAALSDGIGKAPDNSPLMKAARRAADVLIEQIDRARQEADTLSHAPADTTYSAISSSASSARDYPAASYGGGYPVAGSAPRHADASGTVRP